jgi:hypothetical protein
MDDRFTNERFASTTGVNGRRHTDGRYPGTSNVEADLPRDESAAFGAFKFCNVCGDVMTKSTRLITSPLAGLVLVLFGAFLTAFYGLASKFMDTPWYLEFLLPAVYYVGAIHVGVGILFFFIRERVWRCRKCGELAKR